MKSSLKNIRNTSVYKVLQEQSSIIIFLATLIGSLFVVATKINGYFYLLGSFQILNIPTNLIEVESFSIFDIAKIFGLALCYIGGILTMCCGRLLVGSGLFIAKTEYSWYKEKKPYRKRLVSMITCALVFIVFVFMINSTIIILISSKSVVGKIVFFIFFILIQWVYSSFFIKQVYKKSEKEISDEAQIKEQKMNRFLEKMSDEEYQQFEKQETILGRSITSVLFLFPIVVVIVFMTVSAMSNYFASQKAAVNAEKPYQIVSISNEEYVVIAKTAEMYIAAKKVSEDNMELCIDTTEQIIIPIENVMYTLNKYEKIILKE